MAGTFYVNNAYIGAIPGDPLGSATNPFTSIQAAIDSASVTNGDTIQVAAGTYVGNVVINKSISLIGDGRASTTIQGVAPANGTVVIAAGVDGVQLKGFTIQGLDSASPGIESSAVYFDGAQNNVLIEDNKIVANGEAAILTTYGFAHTNVVINNNEIAGKTFTGPNPGGAPGGDQWSVPNWPRPLVFFGTNDASAPNQSSIQFTNNQITGTSGGLNSNGDPQGNVLVNIDAPGAVITGNDFSGFVIGFQPMLRVREENSTITGNNFHNENGGNTTVLLDADAAAGLNMYGNTGATVVQTGTSGSDNIVGTDGNDYFVADAGNDTYSGLAGSDTIDMAAAGSGGAYVDLDAGHAFSTLTGADTFSSIENVKGSVGNDALYGDGQNNTFIATAGSDVIDGRGGVDTFDASSATTAVNLNLDTHAVSGAFTAALTSVEVVKGGSGFDVATTASTMANSQVGWNFSLGSFEVQGQTLVNFEKVQHSDHATWLVKSTTELNYALANAGDGDVIKIAPGKYVGSFTISKALTLESATGNASDVVLSGNFKSINGMAPTDSVATYLQTHTGYSGVNGLTISHDNVTINNITISEYVVGLGLGTASHVAINNVNFTSNVTAVNKNTQSVVSDFKWTGGTVSDGHHGATINAGKIDDDPGAGIHYVVAGAFTGVDINSVVFLNLNEKGLYFEQLDHADIHNIYMYNVGEYGRTTPFGGNGTFGAGIDINLKYGTYTDIDIYNFDFDNVGTSNKSGAGSPHDFGAAITVKARNDGTDYSDPPANVSDVRIHDGTIDGTSTGIRIGEPTKANAGPTGVVVTDVEIRSAVTAEYDNRTGSTLTVNIDSGDQNVSSNPDATGVIAYVDSTDGNTTYTVNAQDTVTENSATGVDTVNARGSFTLGANIENLNLLDAGTDTQDFENFGPGPITNGENGWTVLASDSDQTVINLSGNNVFQMSSDPGSGSFAGPYSPNIGVSAGEPATTSDGDAHIIKFRVKPVDPIADNSRLEVDSGNVQGTDRNNFMVIESIVGEGLRIAVADPRLDGHWSTGTVDDNFVAFTGNRTLVSGLDTSVWHDIEMRILYVDGPNNDVVEIYVDGELVGTSTTFENYRDSLGGPTHAANAEANQTNRIFFRPGNGGSPQDGVGGTNKGFYFDDITNTVTTNSNGTGNNLDNVINGNSGHNSLSGLGGNDTINGGAGNDTIDGGTGTDVLNGGKGNDLFKLAAGDNDIIDGGSGYDTVQITGTAGDDTISVVYNGSALTSLGGSVTNVEAITLSLGAHSTGGDTLSYAGSSQGVVVNLGTGHADGFASISGVENIAGGSGSDSLTGDGNNNTITGNGGSDEIDGGGGIDTAVFSGNFSEYTIVAAGLGFTVSKGGDSDHVVNVEKFKFDDRTVASTSTGLITANPTFATIPGLNLNENTAIGTTVHSVGASDANTVEGDVLAYSLQATGGGAYSGPFSIDSNGNIKVSGTLDFEAATSHSFVVKVADTAGHIKTQTVTVSLNDLNDNPTIITTTAPTTVNENFTGVVYDVNSTDADSSASFGATVYSLSGADASRFSINSNGQITFNTPPDFETKSSYAFTVQAKQGSGAAATQNVNLAVIDLNDNNPVFTSGNTASVDENKPVSTVVYDADATDADLTLGAIVYSLGGADAGAFNINATTGQVRLNAPADFETKNSYSFSVIATQGTSSTAQSVTLTVNNQDEGIDGVDTDVTLAVEKGTTKAPLGDIADAGVTFDILTLNAGGGKFYNGSTLLAVGQTGLTLAQVNALTFSSVNTPASIQLLAHDGGNTEVINVGIAVTPGESKTYKGTSGADHIDGADGNDNILGKNGADVLVGGKGKDTISGGKGDDTISGGKGHDVLTGGAGADHFLFDTAPKNKSSDVITDFVHGTDKISLESDFFAALGSSVSKGEFRSNTTGDAKDGNDKLIYNKSNGELFYDADGNGSGSKVLIATLDPHISNLSHTDFEIV